MKPIQALFTVCTAAFLVFCACSGETASTPLSVSSDATASSITGDMTGSGGQNQPGARPPGPWGLPGPLGSDKIPEGGTYDPSSGRFVVASATDERGATISRSYAFLDAAGAPQSGYSEDLTASISLRFTLDAQPSRGGHTGTIHVEHDLTASGLAGSETARTWNGTMSEQTEGVPPMGGPGGPRGPGGPSVPGGAGGPNVPGGPGGASGPGCPGGPGHGPGNGGPPPGNASGGANPPAGGFDFTNTKMDATSTIRDVVMPHPVGEATWPLSGSITRVERIEGGPNGTEERTSVLTFNGTQYATLAVGDSTVTIDLKDPRPPRPPRPSQP